jgi:hypothetical protein
MATILLYSASITQTGTGNPIAFTTPKQETSGSWTRLSTGAYKFTRGSGNYFVSFSGSVQGTLTLAAKSTTTASLAYYMSGSDSSSLYINTFLSNNSYTLADNILSGSGVQLSVSIEY